MATRIPTRLTRAQGRRFGVTVGLAFLVLAALTTWRGHVLAAQILGGLGASLTLAGLLIPTRLGPVERAWMGLAHAISRVTTPIVMAAMYFGIMTPVGLLRRTFGRNALVHDVAESGYWRRRPDNARRSRSMERQF